jgi:5-methylcytosine-specific restriction endonuclease McrA
MTMNNEEKAIIISMAAMDGILKCLKPSDMMVLYFVYCMEAQKRKAGPIRLTTGQVVKITGWSSKKVAKVKRDLTSIGLIKESLVRKKGRLDGTRIDIFSIPNNKNAPRKTFPKSKKPPWFKESSEYHKYLMSDQWKKKREEAFLAFGRACLRCGKPATSIHHKTYDRVYNEDVDDLEPICHACHKKEHGIK